jgi:hypothetical protein
MPAIHEMALRVSVKAGWRVPVIRIHAEDWRSAQAGGADAIACDATERNVFEQRHDPILDGLKTSGSDPDLLSPV